MCKAERSGWPILAALLISCTTTGYKAVEATMSNTMDTDSTLATAVLGGGCFWCVEAVFLEMEGVLSVEPGYMGGHVLQPTYAEVCRGTTGHVEVVRIRYRPELVRFVDLLEVFFATHDPTTLDRQGNDVGPQYRSLIFTADAEQAAEAERTISALDASGAFPGPIVTELRPSETFWPAEAYHRDYYLRNPEQGYCRAVVRPKVEKFRSVFPQFRKTGAGK